MTEQRQTTGQPLLRGFLKQWQADYEKATRHELKADKGIVTDVYADMDKFGGIGIYVVVERDGRKFEYSPYYNPTPFDECVKDTPAQQGEMCCCDGCQYELGSEAWIDSMTYACDWGDWTWGLPEELDD